VSERESIPLMSPHDVSPIGPDGQPRNPTGGQHPSDHRRREREAQPIPVHHHEGEYERH
jgi:hypothetical protein